MARVTLRNDFHNSSVVMMLEPKSGVQNTTVVYPSAEQFKKAKNALCGTDGCTCGGIRGPQNHDGKKLIVDNSKAGN